MIANKAEVGRRRWRRPVESAENIRVFPEPVVCAEGASLGKAKMLSSGTHNFGPTSSY